MVIVVENKVAALKKGTSFDFIAENSFFTGADAYTMSISFPLAGCQQNLEIFGHLNRKDYDFDKLLLDCEIHDKDFHRYGSISIVEISEKEVKTQFLEGRSANNFASDLDDTYINELDLGKVDEEIHFMPEHYWRSIDEEGCEGYVALPWVNNTSGNKQNEVYFVPSLNDYAWRYPMDEFEFSAQPYLLWLTKKIATCCGLAYDFTAWETSKYRHLVVMNTFPAVWDYHDFAAPLPHWTMSDFFAQLELLLNCEFVIDRKSRKITMKNNVDTIRNHSTYLVEHVIDSYSVELSEEPEESYFEQKCLQYSEDGHNMQKYYSCNWLVEQLKKSRRFYGVYQLETFVTNMSQYKTISGSYTSYPVNNLFYVKDVDTYFVMRCYKATYDKQGKVKEHYMRLMPVNVFGPKITTDKEEPSFTEIGIVPVCLDDVDDGVLPFLECGTYGEADNEDDDKIAQPFAMKVLANGEKEEKQEYFSKIYVAFWDGVLRHRPYQPHPTIDRVEIMPDWSIMYSPYSLRLTSDQKLPQREDIYKVDQSRKYTFSFLSRDLPDVKNIFLIHGKRYLCEKITATFSAETGMSQKLKGVFYRII